MVSLRHFEYADAAALRKAGYGDLSAEQLRDMVDAWNRLEYHGRYFEMFAVVHDDQIVGMISLYQHSDSVVSIGPEIFPAFQRRGFAKEAMRLALETAKKKGCRIAAQQVRSDNQPSIALHKSLGFETDAYGYINKKGDEVFLFLKAL